MPINIINLAHQTWRKKLYFLQCFTSHFDEESNITLQVLIFCLNKKLVSYSSKNTWTILAPQFIGPFEVHKVVNPVEVQLKLSPFLKV